MYEASKAQQYRRPVESNTRSERTRIRLLTTASRIFAEKGYQEATISEICKQADANIAAINYHFGDKETIYLEAWRYAFTREQVLFPSDGGVSRHASPEERLAGRIKALIKHIADEASYSSIIIHKEMAHPTRLLSSILEQEIQPQRAQMAKLLKECLRCEVSEQQVQFCHASIMGQCFQFLRVKHMNDAGQETTEPVGQAEIEAFAEHVVRFSLAGIQALRSQILN
jgi:AcrR family transcriptional regulator